MWWDALEDSEMEQTKEMIYNAYASSVGHEVLIVLVMKRCILNEAIFQISPKHKLLQNNIKLDRPLVLCRIAMFPLVIVRAKYESFMFW
jgi:hypothetical protein